MKKKMIKIVEKYVSIVTPLKYYKSKYFVFEIRH